MLFFNETYMMTTVSFFLGISKINWENNGNRICSLFTIMIGNVSFIFPVFVGIFYTTNHEKLRFKWTTFAQKWGELVEALNFKRNGKVVACIPVCMLLRKLMLAATLVYMNNYPVFQLFIFNF